MSLLAARLRFSRCPYKLKAKGVAGTMNTYYLWDERDLITVSHSIREGFESGFLVKVKPNGAMEAVQELAEMAKVKGKKKRLEVHCHGWPAILRLGAEKGITRQNVTMFGNALRQSLFAGGLIELLACRVAAQRIGSYNPMNDLLKAPQWKISGYREEYHGNIRLRRTRHYGDPERLYDPLLRYGKFKQREDTIREDPNAFFTPAYDLDGLSFCLELASASGCTVRAATEPQMEESGKSTSTFDSPIGDWEYEVFNFFPDGGIKFLGVSPYRSPKIDSFDTDKFTSVA